LERNSSTGRDTISDDHPEITNSVLIRPVTDWNSGLDGRTSSTEISFDLTVTQGAFPKLNVLYCPIRAVTLTDLRLNPARVFRFLCLENR
jgi:hypothetical protein